MAELVDFDKALSSIVEEIDHLTEAELLEVGHFATALVVARTKKGIDADGNRFRPYTESYTEVRTKAGLSSQPDLVRTGHMLGAMAPEVTGRDEVSVVFNAELEAIKAGANDKIRKFLDVRQPAELDAIASVIQDAVAARLSK